MLQRIQSIWLLLAAASGFLTFKFPFYSGNVAGTGQPPSTFEHLTASTSLPILVITVAVISASIIDIFLYKNRKLQLRIVLACIFASLLLVFLYFKQTQNFTEGNYALAGVFTLAIPIFLVLAARGIYKDQKLVKSLDRLR